MTEAKGENKKQEVQSWEFVVDQLHIIWDWTTSISISASTGLGEFGVVPQMPTMYLASARREPLTSPATLEGIAQTLDYVAPSGLINGQHHTHPKHLHTKDNQDQE